MRKFLPYVFILIAVVGVVIGMQMVSPKGKEEISKKTSQENIVKTAKTFAIQIKDGKIIKGDKEIKLTEGDNVILQISSDVTDELHLHGYDKSVELTKDTTSELKFLADKTGRFPYELENEKIELGTVEVMPK